MASGRLLCNLTEDYLTCSICCETFEDPRTLNCDHSFCSKCIVEYGMKCATQGVLSCPICRAESNNPTGSDFIQWIRNLPTDKLINAILKTVEKHTDRKLSTTENDDIFEQNPLRLKSCVHHNTQEIDTFCFTHALEICTECAWRDHDKCECFSIEECSQRLNEKIVGLKERFDGLFRKVSNLKNTSKCKLQLMVQNKESYLITLQRVQKALQEFWAKAQYNVQHLTQVVYAREKDTNSETSKLCAIEKEIEHLTLELGNVRQRNSSDEIAAFLRESNEMVTGHESSLFEVVLNLNRLSDFSLKVNVDLVKFCENFSSLGSITTHEPACNIDGTEDNDNKETLLKQPVEEGLEPSTVVSTEVSEFEQFRSDELSGLKDMERHIPGSDVVETISHHSVHVGETSKGIFTLSGICIVDNSVIVIDQYNGQMLKYDLKQATCTDALALPEPHQLSRVPDSCKVVVTSWSTNKFTTVNVDPRLKVSGEPITTSKHYIGIHVLNQIRLLMTSLDKSIDIVSYQGQIIHTIVPRHHSLRVFTGRPILMPAGIGKLGDNIVIFDSVRKAIIVMEFSGRILCTKRLEGLSGVACHNGQIYASLGQTNVVMTVTPDGHITDKGFVSKSIGVKHPWALDVTDNYITLTEDSPSGRFHIINIGTKGSLT